MTENAVYWMTQDLRLIDNQAWQTAQRFDHLTCVYIVDPRWFRTSRWHLPSMGSRRWQFIQESLSDVNQQLLELGQQLYILYGHSEVIISQLLDQLSATTLITCRRPGTFEQSILEKVRSNHPQTVIDLIDNATLFQQQQLPLRLSEFTKGYSPFRQKAEQHPFSGLVAKPSWLPTQLKSKYQRKIQLPGQCLNRPNWVPYPVDGRNVFAGGENAAQDHLHQYFSSSAPSVYKDVRNELSGWHNSSKLSPWLNQGCLSPRQVAASIDDYESSHSEHGSIHWLFVELLWREYFHWLHHAIGSRLYAFKGISNKKPLTSYYPERFQKWSQGKTPYPLVNACINELKETGYLSNRGRQIIASCLVNELSVDWRYGAAFFEHHLIDYDAAVNWGNWQYIAGVGVDPRGGRHFNIEKQTERFDPHREYCRRWRGMDGGPLDSCNMVDWPTEK